MLFTVIGILFVRLTQMTQCADMGKLLVPWDVKWLRGASGAVGALFLFFVVVSMSAGVGAMLTQLFGVPTWLGSAMLMLAVFLVALLGVSGMVDAFSAMIPILVLATLGFAVGAWCTFGTEGILQLHHTNVNPLMPNWFIATLTFVAYNILGGIGIMSPVGQYVREKKHIYWGIALAGMMLELRSAFVRRRRKAVLAVLCVLSWAGSLLGFAEIIGVVYPIFGYISIVFLIFMVIHFAKARKQEEKQA